MIFSIFLAPCKGSHSNHATSPCPTSPGCCVVWSPVLFKHLPPQVGREDTWPRKMGPKEDRKESPCWLDEDLLFFRMFQKVQLIPGPWYSHVMTYVTSWVVVIYALPETASCGTINEQPAPIRLPSRSGDCGAISSGPVYSIPDIFHCHVSHPKATFGGIHANLPLRGWNCLLRSMSRVWWPCPSTASDVYNPGCLLVSWWGSGKKSIYPQSLAYLHLQ